MQLKTMLQFKMNWARPVGPHHDVVLSSRIRLARNLAKFPFPSYADDASLAAVREATFTASGKFHGFKEAARIELDAIDPLDRYFLMERRLISNSLADTPKHRGVIVGKNEVLSLMVNEEDHLRLQGIDSGLCLKELYLAVDALDDALASALEISFHEEFGYLTACPTNAGTGLRASCLVHLPALSLTGEINGVLKSLSQLGITARGIYGEGTKAMGDFYQLSNTACLGADEMEITAGIVRMVEGLVQKETGARAELSSGERKSRMEDLVYRSLGILTQARLITFEETMQHLSYVRMGLSLKWDLPVDFTSVNELLVLTQPSHIQMLAGKPLDPQDRDFLRATLLRQKFGVRR